MKGKERLKRKQALPHHSSVFADVSSPCITHLFSNLNFLKAGEQTTWHEGGVDNTETLSAWGCGINLCLLLTMITELWIIALSFIYWLSKASFPIKGSADLWQTRILWTWRVCVT